MVVLVAGPAAPDDTKSNQESRVSIISFMSGHETGLFEALKPISKSGANDQAAVSPGRTPQRICRSSTWPTNRTNLVPAILVGLTALKSGVLAVPFPPSKPTEPKPVTIFAPLITEWNRPWIP